MHRKTLIILVGIVGWVALSLVLLFIVSAEDSTSVPCPSEDSCTVDYRDGAYHVTEVVP